MTATLGLGDQVFPIDGYQWGFHDIDLAVTMTAKAVSPDLYLGSNRSRIFATGFLSTRATMSRMTDIVISSFQTDDFGGADPEVTIRLDFKDVKHESALG